MNSKTLFSHSFTNQHLLLTILIILVINLFHPPTLRSQCPLNINESPILNNNGLVLYFPFNGNVQNYGNGSNTATLSGATYTSGICGQALHFDGFNDYVEVNPYIQMSGDITIATWVYLDTLTYEQEIFTTREQCQNTFRRHSQAELAVNHNAPPTSLQSNRILYMVNTHQNCTGYSTGDRYEPLNITYTSGQWFFVAVTIQNNNLESRIVDFYINCQHISGNFFLNTPTAILFTGSYIYKTYIGGGPNVGTYSYTIDGKIDEFRLYNRILTGEELLNLYYNCKPLDITINKYIGNCTGDSANIELENTQNGVSYQLFDSTNQQNIGSAQIGGCNNLYFSTGLVTTPTSFYIKSTKNNCQITLDTLISLNPTYGGSNNYDTLYTCKGDSILIRGNYYFPPNLVIDTLIDSGGCDSILNTTLLTLPLPYVNLGNDTSFCDGDSISLSVLNTFNSILWSTGSTANALFIDTAGTFWVEVSDSLCKNRDTINITNLSHSFIQINDTSFCDGEIWHLILPSSNTYYWSTGNINNQINIQDSGQYWVDITDICKNYKIDFNVETIDCSCMMAVPNVFTPNDDGLNDYFYPIISCIYDEYHLIIFNRWGKLLYETNNQNDKWDGRYLGNEVPEGVYFYLIDYRQPYNGGKAAQHSGSVTIYR